MFSRVVLPQPLAPTRATNCPSGMLRSMSSSAISSRLLPEPPSALRSVRRRKTWLTSLMAMYGVVTVVDTGPPDSSGFRVGMPPVT